MKTFLRIRGLFVFVLICFSAGCAYPKLGELYTPDVHNSTNIYFYLDADIEDTIYYYAYLDEIEQGRLFQGTYLKIPASAGKHTVHVTEWMSGEGAGEALSLSRMVSNISNNTQRVTPDTLNSGVKTTFEVDVVSTSAIYLKINKKEAEETFYGCESTDNTLTVCSRYVYNSAIKLMLSKLAIDELITLRESLK